VRFGVCSLFRSIGNGGLDNLRFGRVLRWKVETAGWECREWYMESWHLQDYSPRLCRLRTDELAIANKY
jgi:hypothetical protein